MIEKCSDCGCPFIRGFHSNKIHYKGCSYLNKRAEITPWSAAESFENYIAAQERNIEYATNNITEARDCLKDTCLDEVYWCRWDCIPKRLEAA